MPGDPAGVGPELCVRLAQQPRSDCQLLAFADPDTLHTAAAALGLPLRLLPEGERSRTPGDLTLRVIGNPAPNAFGITDPRNATAVIAALDAASDACLRDELDGIVTGPTHKASINAAGIAYSGTTEHLARRADSEVVMMLANDIVRVALATTHLPLRAVPDAINTESLEQVLRIIETALRTDFDIVRPVIAVLGLNPHAGESGHMGREEIEVIEPLLIRLRGEGMQLIGPLPADTAFLPSRLTGFDAVLAMYHDQGLPVLKYSGFERAVNITLGLPYPRVAVDHGTALDLAGKGLADPSSLFAAVDCCARLATVRKRNRARSSR